jgi:uncharacterized membrane protein
MAARLWVNFEIVSSVLSRGAYFQKSDLNGPKPLFCPSIFGLNKIASFLLKNSLAATRIVKTHERLDMLKLIPLLILAIFLVTGCTSHTYDDIEPIPQEVVPDLVVYTDVKVIIDNACTNCHSSPPRNGAPMPLTTFMDVKTSVENTGLLDRISRNEGESGVMPVGGPRLPQASIDLLVKWNQDGLLEN